MEEIWKEYKTYNGNTVVTDIEVSNYGNVRGNIFNGRKFEKVEEVNGRMKIGDTGVYELVWKLFGGDKPKGYDIHHKDFNKLNDKIDNLECITRAEHTRIHSKNMSNITKQKISDKLKGSKRGPFTEEHIRKLRDSHLGHKVSKETKQKLSEIISNYPRNEEWNNHISESKMGHEVSDECRRKISEKQKGIKRGKFYNNGTICKRFMSYEEACLNGYNIIGKIKKQR